MAATRPHAWRMDCVHFCGCMSPMETNGDQWRRVCMLSSIQLQLLPRRACNLARPMSPISRHLFHVVHAGTTMIKEGDAAWTLCQRDYRGWSHGVPSRQPCSCGWAQTRWSLRGRTLTAVPQIPQSQPSPSGPDAVILIRH